MSNGSLEDSNASLDVSNGPLEVPTLHWTCPTRRWKVPTLHWTCPTGHWKVLTLHWTCPTGKRHDLLRGSAGVVRGYQGRLMNCMAQRLGPVPRGVLALAPTPGWRDKSDVAS